MVNFQLNKPWAWSRSPLSAQAEVLPKSSLLEHDVKCTSSYKSTEINRNIETDQQKQSMSENVTFK